jgi:DNA-directed RNA polymerase sigma subunit (sigma70/sigma32)
MNPKCPNSASLTLGLTVDACLRSRSMGSEMTDSTKSPRSSAGQDGDEALRALRGKLRGVLSRLPDIEREVVELRMGLVDGTPAKPGEVADRLGLTIPEVKRIEERAFTRIREVVPIKRLQRFL